MFSRVLFRTRCLAASTPATNRIWLPGTRKPSLDPRGCVANPPNVCSRHGSQPNFQYADRVIVKNGVAKSGALRSSIQWACFGRI